MPSVIHEPDQHRFSAAMEGEQAVLEYTLVDGNGIDFTRTFVPPSFRGKGVAEKLVCTGLAWAREQGYTITASCWYVQKFGVRAT